VQHCGQRVIRVEANKGKDDPREDGDEKYDGEDDDESGQRVDL